MITFLIGLAILFFGGTVYCIFCRKVFGIDDRPTPAVTKNDGVDFIPMKNGKTVLYSF